MQIFVQHQQVVAEIQKCFARTLVGEGGTANVKNAGGGAGPNAVAHELESPAQINLFHVGEKGEIQAGGSFPCFALDEYGRAGSPKNGHRVVVLALVGFNVAKNPTPTKRIPVFVDESAGCAGVFEFVALIIVDEVRLRRTQIRVLRNQFEQWR